MRYIFLLVVIGSIGWAAGTQFGVLGVTPAQPAMELNLANSTGNPIELAKEAKRILEGGPTEPSEAKERDLSETNTQGVMNDANNQNNSGAMLETSPNTGPATAAQTAVSATHETMLVAGGCFWCVEADLEKLTGVVEVLSGYAEGTNEHPS